MAGDKSSMVGLDSKRMLDTIEKLPEHLTEGLRIGRMAGPLRSVPRNVVVCGMGGSAIGGYLLEEWMAAETGIPCTVCSSYSLPAWVDRNSLVIAASYSGNTEETLSMFADARKKRAVIVTISSGGRLAKMSGSAGVPVARIPTGMVPRATLGYVFGAMIGILDRSGVARVEQHVQESIRTMEATIAQCGNSVRTSENPAKILAHELFSCVPVVIGHGISGPVAKRWANQFNENSKVMAHSAVLPEMDHNEIVGWMEDARSRNFAAVFLDHEVRDSAMRRRIDATRKMLERVTSVHCVSASGRRPMAKMFSLIVIGDFASVYLALLRNYDPSTNEPIDELKRTLSKR